jgi:hypothetical protein
MNKDTRVIYTQTTPSLCTIQGVYVGISILSVPGHLAHLPQLEISE